MPVAISPEARREKDIRTRRKLIAILRVIHDAGRPLGGTRIAQDLRASGLELSQRTVRHYLHQADEEGLTVNLGRRGRQLTDKGQEELRDSLAVDKVGFVAGRMDGLAYQMSFRMPRGEGDIVVNVSTFPAEAFEAAVAAMYPVFAGGWGMGRYLMLSSSGATIGSFHVPEGQVAVATVCSVILNGVLLKSGIAVTARFGGLLEVQEGQPFRFTEIINYDGTTVDPLEIFIKGHMTDLHGICETGHGFLGASFREVPAEALPKVKTLCADMSKLGLGAPLVIGRPGQPVLDVPVAPGRVGLVILGGLNPIAALEEAGIPTTNAAMHALLDFHQLFEYAELRKDPRMRLRF